MKGGNILGTGGYGCVFDYDANIVGKINFLDPMWMEDPNIENYETFVRIQEKIHEIDPNENYFIPVRKIVAIPYNHPSIPECLYQWSLNASEKSFLKVQQKIEKKESFEVYLQTKVDIAPEIKKWNLKQVRHAYLGLKLLHQNGICHHDISIGNFGFKNNLPVFIDMDGSGPCDDPILRVLDGKPKLSLANSACEDFEAFRKMLQDL